MRIGVPKEIKTKEFRVGLTPPSVQEYIRKGHEVIVETGAGAGIQAPDEFYIAAGATIAKTAKEVFDTAEMIVKVKEPQPEECKMLHEGQILFTYLHLAADIEQTKGLIDSGAVAIAYETVTNDRGGLPLLAPMSEVAGRMSVHVGAFSFHTAQGGMGILIGGAPGVKPANVTIIGGGVAGMNAAKLAIGAGGRVNILEKSLDRIRYLDDVFGTSANIVFSTQGILEEYITRSDLVIGAVLIPGARAPKLITRDLLKSMRPRAVFVDIAIDQGGIAETSRATTHDNPTFIEEDVVHYCVANMPGAVPNTSAQALNNAVLPYGLKIADKGWQQALKDDKHLRNGLNVCKGHLTQAEVARDLGLKYTEAESLLSA